MILDNTQQEEGFLGKVYRRSKSKRSVNTYNSALRSFETFCLEKHNLPKESVITKIQSGHLNVYNVLDDFVGYLDNLHKSPNTIFTYYTGVKKFLRHFDIEIYSEKARDKIVLPTKQQILDDALTREIISRILNQCNPKMRALLLVLLSSGMRIGEAVSLRVRDIEFSSSPVRVVIPASATKTNRQRETYISIEASQALKDYLQYKIKRQDQLVFSKNEKVHVAESDAERLFRQIMQKLPDLDGVIEGSNNRHSIHLHSFRKFFITVGSDAIGESNAHALAGHGFYMDTYYRKQIDERRETYLKLEPYVTIGNSDKLRKELDERFTNQAKNIEEIKQKQEQREKEIEVLSGELKNYKFMKALERIYYRNSKQNIDEEQYFQQPQIKEWVENNISRIKEVYKQWYDSNYEFYTTRGVKVRTVEELIEIGAWGTILNGVYNHLTFSSYEDSRNNSNELED